MSLKAKLLTQTEVVPIKIYPILAKHHQNRRMIITDSFACLELPMAAQSRKASSQCLPTPQMYHFLPGVANTIVSFPVVNASLARGLMQFRKPVPFTRYTL